MQNWQYHTVQVANTEYQEKKKASYREWTITFTDGSEKRGLNNILNYYGSSGWELVGVVADTMFDQRLYFKRPVSS